MPLFYVCGEMEKDARRGRREAVQRGERAERIYGEEGAKPHRMGSGRREYTAGKQLNGNCRGAGTGRLLWLGSEKAVAGVPVCRSGLSLCRFLW